MSTSTEVTKLREELEPILSRYVPMDDCGFILEKIEESVSKALDTQDVRFKKTIETIRNEIEAERETVRNEVGGIRSAAIEGLAQASEQIDAAYNEGFSQAASQIPSRPSTFQVIVGISLVTIGLILAARSIWKNI